ncbi:phospholipase carboxylesterase [Seiridium cupressi]|uniref:Phospholipase/carboxylesterase/thioesterase domain-containing protein n=1 Tax=Seiridium unicorne TaxID=138068 RepID=A0ABR2UJ71_9PEZI
MELGRSVVPPETEHTHTIVFLHGRGDTAQELAENLFLLRDSSKRTLSTIFPSVRWVFPQAELLYCERDDQDWSQWFDVWNVLDFSDREELQALGLQDSVRNITKLMHKEALKVGNLNKVVLAGFGQGGSTAIHVLLNMPAPEYLEPPKAKRIKTEHFDVQAGRRQRLAGVMGFNCRLPFPGGTLDETREVLALEGKPSNEILRNTPVFLAHCMDDPLVFVEYGRQLAEALGSFGVQGVSREYPDGGHRLNAPQGIDDIVVFLEAQGLKPVPA